jgi:hypothetical protein
MGFKLFTSVSIAMVHKPSSAKKQRPFSLSSIFLSDSSSLEEEE